MMFGCKKRHITSEDIAIAFNRNKGHLLAMESKHCCNGTTTLTVGNQAVLLYKMLAELGFTDAEIQLDIHSHVRHQRTNNGK
jgi:hypothetical protein